jgi:PAS domain-containing protein
MPAMDLPAGSPLPGEPLNSSPNGAESLRGVGMLDLLECDKRPTFVLDVTLVNRSREGKVHPVYWNAAMATIYSGRLLQAFKSVAFSHFAHGIDRKHDRPFLYRGFSWTKVLVAGRWDVISGTSIDSSARNESADMEGLALAKKTSRSTIPTFDWTHELPPVRISTHVAWARNIDWAATPLGSMSSWSAQLRSIANVIMQDPRPAVGFWGPDLIMIYNEAYIKVLGSLHPCMGHSARVAFGDVWYNYFEPIITRNLLGETVEKTNTAIHMVCNGLKEETYFSLKSIPILDSEGATVGHYEPLVETVGSLLQRFPACSGSSLQSSLTYLQTREVISQRQSQTILELSEELPQARNADSYWTLATKVLSRNDKDISFGLLYSADADPDDSASSKTQASGHNHQCTLRGSFGLPEGSPAGPNHLDIRKDYGFTPYFRQAMLTGKPITVHFDQDSRAADLVQGVQWRGFGDPCRAAVIFPLRPTSLKEDILGFVVIGLNSRRPYDEHYRQFILVASRILSTSLASVLLHEENIGRREWTLANVEAMRFELRNQLLESQKEAERNIWKFQRFAERADIGIFIIGMNGVYSYRNEAWYSILEPADRDIGLADAWEALIDDDYAPVGQAKFRALVETKQHQSFELRLKRTWNAPSQRFDDSVPEQQHMWVLCSIFPELTEDGEVLEIVGCITDIRYVHLCFPSCVCEYSQ